MNTGRIIISALAASILAIPAMAEDAPGYFKVPGTETTMKVYGKAETWAWYNMDQGGSGIVYTTTTPPVAIGIADQSWTPKNTVDSVVYGRVGITSTTPSDFGDVTTKVEFETKSAAGNDSWGSGFRLRHAYGEFAGLLVGQTNSLWVDWQYCPGYNDTFHPDFNGSQYRTRQIRYTFTPTKELKVGFSVEQDKSGGDTTKLGPAIVGSVNYAADWGFVTGTVGYQKYENDALNASGGFDSHTGTGTSFNVGGAWNITKNDTLGLRIIKGGGQMGSNGLYVFGDGFYDNGDGGFNFYKSMAWDLGYSHAWNDKFTTNVGVGQITFPKDNDTVYSDGALGKVTVNEFFINTNWQVTKNANFGLEYLDSSAKTSEDDTVIKTDGTYTNKFHSNSVNLKFTYNFF